MITRNAARCPRCRVVIESTHRHDYKVCECGRLGVDGGQSYLKRTWTGPIDGPPGSMFDELSEFE